MAGILVPFDFSENAIAALDQALLIANKNKSNLELLHITNKAVCQEYPESWECKETSIDKLTNELEKIIQQRLSHGKIEKSFDYIVTAKESALINGGIINHMLQKKADLLIMGTHGSSGIYDKAFGSNTSNLVNHALFPLLTIPPNWKAVEIQHCVAALKLDKLAVNSDTIKNWGQFFQSDVEAVQFTIVAEAEGTYANKNTINDIPCRLIINEIETPLAKDIIAFASTLKNTVLILFTREKTFLEKILQPNISYNVTGASVIPILSLPISSGKE